MILSDLEKDVLKQFNINNMISGNEICFNLDLSTNKILEIIEKLFSVNFLVKKPLNEINPIHSSTSPHTTISDLGKEYLKNNP